MGIEFLGNKSQLIDFIMDNMMKSIDSSCQTLFDVFSGTGSVSAAFKKAGFNVIANDFLHFTSTLTKAILYNHEAPKFVGLRDILRGVYDETDPYTSVLNYLNKIDGQKGFIYNNYSPASENNEETPRMYFTEINALKIDAIRLTINEWSEFLLENERNLLISDLLNATSAVSNIAGTYGSYMKFWKRKSLQNILLEKSPIIPGKANYRVFCRNANEVVSECSVDVVYADPPYTKRQYSAYYHILETISRYDDPQLFGSTGLRRWQDNSSDYCYRRKAPRALQDLISKAQCKYFILSYNNEGQIDHENILSIMKNFGDLTVFETPYRRYKSNSLIQKEVQVIERLYILKMRRENVAI